MAPVDYRFFGGRRYLQPACLWATRGCTFQYSFCVSSRFHGPFRTKPLDVLEREIDQLRVLHPDTGYGEADQPPQGVCFRQFAHEVLGGALFILRPLDTRSIEVQPNWLSKRGEQLQQ